MSKDKKSKGHFGGNVGYKNPPVDGQFKPGESGNKKGRPKKEKDELCDLVDKVFFGARKVQINNQTVSMTAMEVMLNKLAESAAKGNVQAARLMINISEKFGFNETKITNIPPFVPSRGVLARDFEDEDLDDE